MNNPRSDIGLHLFDEALILDNNKWFNKSLQRCVVQGVPIVRIYSSYPRWENGLLYVLLNEYEC